MEGKPWGGAGLEDSIAHSSGASSPSPFKACEQQGPQKQKKIFRRGLCYFLHVFAKLTSNFFQFFLQKYPSQ